MRRHKLVLEQVLEGHADRVWHLAWSPTGDTLASCSSDKTVRLWCPAGGAGGGGGGDSGGNDGSNGNGSNGPTRLFFTCAATLEDSHTKTVRCSAWSPDGSRLLTVSFDARAAMWRRTLPAQAEAEAAAGGTSGAAARAVWRQVWESGACHESEIKGADWSPCGGFAATCGRDRHVWVWELLAVGGGGGGEAMQVEEEEGEDEDDGGGERNGGPSPPSAGGALEAVDVKSGHSGDIKAVAWHPKGDGVFATASYDDTVRVWAAEGGLGAAASGAAGGGEWECEQVLEARKGAAGEGGGGGGVPVVELEVWRDDDDDDDDEVGERGGGAAAAATNGGGGGEAAAAATSPPTTTASFSDRGGHTSTVWDVRFSRHDGGARMATASADGTVRVWSAGFEPGSAGRRPAFAPEAVVLAGWRRQRRQGRQGGEGGGEGDEDDDDGDEEDGPAEVLSVDWSSRGWLATGDTRNALRVFEPVASGAGGEAGGAPPRWRLAARCQAPDRLHPRDVNCVRWHPTDASLVATACDDGAVRLWRLVEE